MSTLRQQVRELISEINGDVHHGECFYEKNMLDDFIANLDKMKNLAIEYYNENQEKD